METTNRLYTVQGKIMLPDGTALSRTKVELYRKSFRTETKIGDAVTDRQGHYSMQYPFDASGNPKENGVHLIVRIVDGEGTTMAASPILFNAGETETIDLVAELPANGNLSEFERLEQELAHETDSFAAEPLNHDDVLFLTGQTSFSSGQIEGYAASVRLSAETGLPAGLFYACARYHLPMGLSELVAQRASTLRDALEHAVRNGIIPVSFRERLDSHIERLHRLPLELNKAASGRRQEDDGLQTLLQAAGLPPKKQRYSMDLYKKHEGGAESFWNVLLADPQLKPNAERVRFALQLGTLTQQNGPLVQAIMKQASGSEGQVSSIRDLVRWSEEDWKNLLHADDVRRTSGETSRLVAVSGADEADESSDVYVQTIVRTLENAFPSAAIAKKIRRDGGGTIGLEVADFLDLHPEFDLRTTPVDSFLADKGTARLARQANDQADDRALSGTLKSMQRVFRLAPSYESMNALLEDGVHSAYGIAQMGKGVFIDRYGERLGGEKQAYDIYARASQVTATALTLFGQYHESANAVQFAATAPSAAPAGSLPSWSEMFGSLEWCDCDHCRTVYSPAAYLVDILHFLSKCPAEQGSALDVLLGRRPDIGSIPLSCENTNVPIPYVDLVNETLENAVSPETAVSANNTTSSAEELGASPEYVNSGAYDRLAQQIYPWNLPYDYWLDESRTYLEHLGVKREALIAAFRPFNDQAASSELTAAAELLNLSAFECGVIIGNVPNHPEPWKFWGFVAESNDGTLWTTALSAVPHFLQRSGLTYVELTELLNARFVNPDGTMKLSFEDAAYSLDKAHIDNVSAAALGRIHRFVRLQRKLGWTMEELDKTIAVVNGGALDESLIIRLADLVRLRSKIKTPLLQMLGWWAPIDTHTYPDREKCLYDRLFLNQSVVSPVDTAFQLKEPERNELADTTGNLKAHVSTLLAAFEISQAEFEMLSHAFLADDRLNLANLSVLCRNVSLSQAIGLSIADYVSLRQLISVDPFASGAGTVQETLRFISVAEEMKRIGYSASEWTYLLLHRRNEPGTSEPFERQFVELLETMRSRLKQIGEEHAITSDPQGVWIASTLSVMFPQEIADSMVRAIVQPDMEDERQLFLIDNYFVEFIDPVEARTILSMEPNKEVRFECFLGPLAQARKNRLSISAVQELLCAYFELGEETIQSLLFQFVQSPIEPHAKAGFELINPTFVNSVLPISPAGFPSQYRSVVLLDKLASFIHRLQLTSAEVNYLFAKSSWIGFPDWTTFPVEACVVPPVAVEDIVRLSHLLEWRDGLSGTRDWYNILNELHRHQNDAAVPDEVLQHLCTLTGCELGALKAMIGPECLQLRFPFDYQNEQWLLRLDQSFALLRRLGVPLSEAKSWAMPALTVNEARSIKQAVKARYDREQWLSVAKALKDPLREKQRTMLSLYLIDRFGLESTDDLFSRFLIDVEMSALQQTSRIKQAISSVQLFVQRCFMNLEPQAKLKPEAARDWKTMKNYRVWEANRKIFLYPENWVEPDLRDDKSAFFNELDHEFMENEATQDTAERAFMNYLHKLDQVSWLEICAMYHDHEDRGNGLFNDIIHVFGRTRNSPHVYYYRRFENSLYWTAWEKVDVDIEGEHLLPVIYKSRLYLFWPVFTEAAVKSPVNPQGELPKMYLQVGLAWSEYQLGKWSPKTITNANFELKNLEYNRSELLFHAVVDKNNDLVIHAKFLYGGGYTYYRSLFYFKLSNPNGRIDAFPLSNDLQHMRYPLPVNSKNDYNSIVNQDFNTAGRLVIPLEESHNGYPYRMADTIHFPDTFKIVYPQNNIWFDGTRPFYYQDGRKMMFVTSRKHYDYTGQLTWSLPIERLADWKAIQLRESNELAASFRLGIETERHEVVFHTAYHPYVSDFVEILSKRGIDGLLQLPVQSVTRDYFESEYEPNAENVGTPYPADNVDFTSSGPYALYNWELFFHTPFMLANRLSKNQRFEEAQKWFHYIFNPTDGTSGSTERFWKLFPFFQNNDRSTIEETMLLLQYEGSDPEMLQRRDELLKLIAAWKNNPFNPHLIARIRISAYQKAVVMKYLDNLIAWGDQLFRQETIESINEATQLYMLASELLGDKPQFGVKRPNAAVKTYTDIAPELDAFSNALVQLENDVPATVATAAQDASVPAILSVGTALYFSIPPNDKLLGYWDTVADRLFKIRHSMSIDGTLRQLPLFQPPIDPGVLASAASSGVDIGAALQDVFAPLPHYRYATLAQKSIELCAEVKAFGGALLSALEKKDAEKLSQIRSGHEVKLLSAMLKTKELQIEENREGLEGLKQSRQLAETRKQYYQTLHKQDRNVYETNQLNQLAEGNKYQHDIMRYELGAQAATLIPNVTFGTSGVASPVITATYGGTTLSMAAQAYARYLAYRAGQENYKANRNSILSTFDRRKMDWDLQVQLADKELVQIDKQIAAARVRLSIAEKELLHQQHQIRNADEIDVFMRTKYTNSELYDWMVAQTSSLYFRSYQLAYDTAKRAERALNYELGTDKTFIKFGYWDNMKKGLLAGEKLFSDLKRMEMDYLDQNKREYELTKHVSLGLLDPLALTLLKETGECYVELPESVFDLDYAGHYMRRIKSVSLSIPCVTGPYTGVNCTLTLLQSSIRKTNLLSGGKYARVSGEDARFVDRFGINQSIVTSGAQNDSGLFETNFRDERYLPFEGCGAISRWKLELPEACNAFDVNTVSDVVLHMKYTAREGGGQLKKAALEEVVQAQPGKEQMLMLSGKQHFSVEWHRFLHPAAGQEGQALLIDISEKQLPYSLRGRTVQVSRIEMFLKLRDTSSYAEGTPLKLYVKAAGSSADKPAELIADPVYDGLPHVALKTDNAGLGSWSIAAREGDIALLADDYRTTETIGDTVHHRLDSKTIEDLWILLHYHA